MVDMEGSISEILEAMATKRKVLLHRIETGDDGTFGEIKTDGAFIGYSGECPWRDNEPGFSCIPAGEYTCELINTPKHGKAYEVKNVPGRRAVLFHSGNWSGDSRKKFKSQVEGCILLGRSIGKIVGQKAVTSSKDAVSRFMADLDGDSFQLTITWADEIKPEV